MVETPTAEAFVGRVREVELLSEAWRAAASGAGGVVLVAGEPGIGKTTLVEEALTRTDAPAVWGRCPSTPGMPPYWPWTQILRHCESLRIPPDGGVGRVLGGEKGDDTSRYELFEGVLDALQATAAGAGLAVVLDDLQWADEASLALFSFVVESARRTPLLVMGLYRDTEVADTEPLARVVEQAAGHGTVLELPGLGSAEVAQLLSALGVASEGGVGGVERLDRVHRLTGGNPFFVREMAALAGAGGGLEGELAAGVRLPGGVRAVVGRRLARLGHGTQDLLVWAAVAGELIELAELVVVTGREPGDVLAALDEAVAARIVEPSGTTRWTFSHDLVREALVASVGEATRARRHWAFGTVLAGSASLDDARIARVAGHLVAGVAAGEVGVAIDWTVRAAEASSAVLAYEQAAYWYEQALAMHRSWTSGDDNEIDVLLGLGSARLAAGQFASARDAFTRAASLARRRGDPFRLAEAALGLGAGFGGFEVQLFDQVQVELLEDALAALGDDETPMRALVLSRLSVALAFVEPSSRRVELAEHAIATARSVGDPVALASALAAWCDASAGPDHLHARLRAADEIVTAAGAAGSRPLELLGRRHRVVALLELGRWHEARAEVDRYAWVADSLRQPLYRWYVPLWRAALTMAEGDLATAERHAAEAEDIGARAESANAAVLTRIQRWVRLRHQHRFDEATSLMAEIVTDSPDIGAPEALDETRLVVETARGNVDAATALAHRLVKRDWSAPRSDSEWLPNTVLVAEAAATIGHRELAEVVHDALRPFAELFAVEGIGAAINGPVAHYLALTADLLGNGEGQSFRQLADRLRREAGMAVSPPAITAAGRLSPTPSDVAASASLRRVGPAWAATYAGTTAHLNDSKGLRDIIVLLRAPGTAVHVTELTGVSVGTTAPDLDRTAIAAYRQRLTDLEGDLAEAEADNDDERAARARAERDFLLDELSRSLGLGGRARRSGDPVERARKTVRARIRDCIAHVSAVHPQLGRHWANTVRTGTWCSYEPEQPVHWHID